MSAYAMSRRIVMLLILVSLVTVPAITAAQPLPPPTGIHDALADLSKRLGTTFALICDNPADGSTCQMNDLRLNWSWSEERFPDTRMGCGTMLNYVEIGTDAYVYKLTFEGRAYDYRQNIVAGDMFLCTTSGAVAIELNRARSACPITPRLAVGGMGQVRSSTTPNNVRASAAQNGELLGQIPPAGIFSVIAGPQCLENYVWWQVNYGGLVGWTPEGGSSGEYYLEPLDSEITGNPATAPQSSVLNASAITADNAASLLNRWSVTLPSFPFDMSYARQLEWMVVVDVNGLAIYKSFGSEVPMMIDRNTNIIYDRVAFSSSGEKLTAAQSFDAADGTRLSQIWVWNVHAVPATNIAQDFPIGEVTFISVPQPIQGTITKLDFSYGGNLLGFATRDQLTIYDLTTGQIGLTIEGAPAIENFAFTTSGFDTLVTVNRGNNLLELWDTSTRQQRGSLPISPDVTTQGLGNAITFSEDGNQFAYVSAVNTVTVVNTQTLATVRTLTVPNENTMVIQNILYTASGNLMIVSGVVPQLDSFDYLFDIRTAIPIQRQLGGDGSQAIFGYDGTLHWLVPNPPMGVKWVVFGVQ